MMNVSVAKRLGLGFACAVVLLLVADLVAIRGLLELQANLRVLVESSSRQIELASSMIDRSQEMRVQYRQIVLDDAMETRQKTRDKYQAAQKSFLELMGELKQVMADPAYPPSAASQASLQKATDWQPTAFEHADKAIALALEQKDAEAKVQISTLSSPSMAKLNVFLRDHAKLIHEENQQMVANAESDMYSVKVQLVVLGLLGVLASAILGWLITRSIAVPLAKLQGFLTNISQNFDFTKRVEVQRQDEIGDSLHAVNKLLDVLQGSMQQLARVGQDVSVSVHTLSDTSQRMSNSSRIVSESTSSMAAGIEQVTVSIGHVADRAQETDQTARKAGELALTGGKVIDETIASINQIAEQVKDSAVQIDALKERTTTINAVVNVIKDIADQTNLLALNAAIEAARAGEQGRGFAVVADEVRKLAERTASSTQEIIGTVNAIQSEASATVAIMQQAVLQVDAGVGHAQKASDAIRAIRNSAEEVVSQVSEITGAMREQSSASSAMAQQVEKVAQMSEENSASAVATAEEGQRLRQFGSELESAIRRYQV